MTSFMLHLLVCIPQTWSCLLPWTVLYSLLFPSFFSLSHFMFTKQYWQWSRITEIQNYISIYNRSGSQGHQSLSTFAWWKEEKNLYAIYRSISGLIQRQMWFCWQCDPFRCLFAFGCQTNMLTQKKASQSDVSAHHWGLFKNKMTLSMHAPELRQNNSEGHSCSNNKFSAYAAWPG